ncbi:copper transporter Ctr [Trichoderma parareesei]|uniref:Copper transport protein n=1 Tax=Trichoderma parareesei TaxID=858221 RepID=A0A2H2YX87_TRIPA|nr:copper transporter Ctr [Trichoderma parareesei]
MGDGGSQSCKISMLWNWYTVDACFLSSSWQIRNRGMFAASCIGIVLLVASVELMRRIGPEYDNSIVRQWHRQAAMASDRAGGRTQGSAIYCEKILFRATPLQQLVRAIIHAATFGAAYIIMLLAMYFNGYIIICIIVGSGVGKFACHWLSVEIDLQPGEGERLLPKPILQTTICCD